MVYLRIVVLLALMGLSPTASAAGSISPQEAGKHIGETATVCGTVASTNFASKSKGQPTYLNLDRPYPQQIFTVLIWGSDRARFGTPEISLMGKRLCATGLIKDYRGKPEIIATDPRQLVSE